MTALNPRQFENEDILGALGGTSMRPHPDAMSHEELQDHLFHDHMNGRVGGDPTAMKILHSEEHIENEGHEEMHSWLKSNGVKTVPGYRVESWKTHRHD